MDTPNSKHRRKHASEPSLIIDTDIHVESLLDSSHCSAIFSPLPTAEYQHRHHQSNRDHNALDCCTSNSLSPMTILARDGSPWGSGTFCTPGTPDASLCDSVLQLEKKNNTPLSHRLMTHDAHSTSTPSMSISVRISSCKLKEIPSPYSSKNSSSVSKDLSEAFHSNYDSVVLTDDPDRSMILARKCKALTASTKATPATPVPLSSLETAPPTSSIPAPSTSPAPTLLTRYLLTTPTSSAPGPLTRLSTNSVSAPTINSAPAPPTTSVPGPLTKSGQASPANSKIAPPSTRTSSPISKKPLVSFCEVSDAEVSCEGSGSMPVDLVQSDQRKVGILKQGLLQFPTFCLSPPGADYSGSDKSMLVVQSGSSMGQDRQLHGKQRLLNECIDGVGKGESLGWKDRTTGLAQLPSGALHHINLMHSSVATNYKNRNLDFQKQTSRDIIRDLKGEPSGSGTTALQKLPCVSALAGNLTCCQKEQQQQQQQQQQQKRTVSKITPAYNPELEEGHCCVASKSVSTFTAISSSSSLLTPTQSSDLSVLGRPGVRGSGTRLKGLTVFAERRILGGCDEDRLGGSDGGMRLRGRKDLVDAGGCYVGVLGCSGDEAKTWKQMNPADGRGLDGVVATTHAEAQVATVSSMSMHDRVNGAQVKTLKLSDRPDMAGESALHSQGSAGDGSESECLKNARTRHSRPTRSRDQIVHHQHKWDEQHIGAAGRHRRVWSEDFENAVEGSRREGRGLRREARLLPEKTEVAMQDMLRRLQMLEEIQHRRDLGAAVEPPKTSTGYNSASHHCSIRTEPSTSTTSHLTDIQPHCIVVESAGHCSTSLHPVKKEAFSLGSQGHSSLRHPSSQNHVSSRDGPPGSSNTCKEAEEDSEVSCALEEARKLNSECTDYPEQWTHRRARNPVSNLPQKDQCSRESMQALVQIERVLYQVRLSQREMEFQCSVEEMGIEKSHMGKLLQLLTNYSIHGESNSVVLEATISDYFSQLPPPSPPPSAPSRSLKKLNRALKSSKVSGDDSKLGRVELPVIQNNRNKRVKHARPENVLPREISRKTVGVGRRSNLVAANQKWSGKGEGYLSSPKKGFSKTRKERCPRYPHYQPAPLPPSIALSAIWRGAHAGIRACITPPHPPPQEIPPQCHTGLPASSHTEDPASHPASSSQCPPQPPSIFLPYAPVDSSSHPPPPLSPSTSNASTTQAPVPFASGEKNSGTSHRVPSGGYGNVAIPLNSPQIVPSLCDANCPLVSLGDCGNVVIPLKSSQSMASPLYEHHRHDKCIGTQSPPPPLLSSVPGVDEDGGIDVGLQTSLTPSKESSDIPTVTSISQTSSKDHDHKDTNSTMHLCIEVNPKLRPHQHLPPSTTSPKAAPLHTQCHPMGVISEQGTVDSISSKELDKRIMKCLQQSTSEWVQKELLTRLLLSQDRAYNQDYSGDHIIPPRLLRPRFPKPTSPSNSCSTCTSDNPGSIKPKGLGGLDSVLGLDVFVGSGVPVDDDMVQKEIRDVVEDELSRVIQTLMGKEGCLGSSNASSSACDEENVSYTPPSSISLSSSPSLPTPPSTPHSSLTPSRFTPVDDQSSVEEHHRSPALTTPAITPPLSGKSNTEIFDNIVGTPLESEPETSNVATMESSTSSTTVATIPTPSSTPPTSNLSLTKTTPQLTPELVKSVTEQASDNSEHARPSPSHLSLSAVSSSEPTTSAPPPSITPSSLLTTDQQLSMGEFLLHKFPVPLAPANTSLSEGEVPLSPGDARWYALHASKMRGAPSCDSESTLEAFLDLKNSPDPSSSGDTSMMSGSLFESNVSVGEMHQKKRKRHGPDPIPFKKFLSQFHAAVGSDTTSTTCVTVSHSNDTLTDLPSLLDQNDAESANHHVTVNSSPPEHLNLVIRKPKSSLPYHKKFPLDGWHAPSGRASPGEVNKLLSCVQDINPLPTDISVKSTSEGAVPVIIHNYYNRIQHNVEDTSTVIGDPVNELREGIDIISISDGLKKRQGLKIPSRSLQASSLLSLPHASPFPPDCQDEISQMHHEISNAPNVTSQVDEDKQTSYVTQPVDEDEDKQSSYVISELDEEELNPHVVHGLPLLEAKPEEVGPPNIIMVQERDDERDDTITSLTDRVHPLKILIPTGMEETDIDSLNISRENTSGSLSF